MDNFSLSKSQEDIDVNSEKKYYSGNLSSASDFWRKGFNENTIECESSEIIVEAPIFLCYYFVETAFQKLKGGIRKIWIAQTLS